MYLKSIEIQGFKSFAKKTKITFNESITAVVGPNGSGKSNILDAITWALGEQRVKSLRGNKMSDIIFSGTDTRKPLGMAQVQMTFDNSSHWLDLPYEEVTVQRRMYRSGESEFRINKDLCRLKDIQELFMDTGIGRDGYSFIGQGRIDAVLSTKPEDRRSVFEEAAGISKFKKRKLESLKKLDGVLDDLARIEDLLVELTKQEEALKEEKNRYLDYQDVYEEKKKLDHVAYALGTKKQREKLLELDQNLLTLRENSHKMKEDLGLKKIALSKEEESLDLEKKALEEKNLALQKDLEDWLRLEAQEVDLKNQLDKIKDQLDRLDLEGDNLKTKALDLANKKDEHLTQGQALKKKANEAKNQLEKDLSLIKDLEKTLAEEKKNLSALALQHQQANQGRTQILLRIDSQRQMVKEKNQRKDKIEALLSQVTREVKDLSRTKETQENDLKDLETKRNVLLQGEKGKADKLRQLAQEKAQVYNELNSLKVSYDQEKNRLNFLQSTLDHYDGFQKSVKSFLRVTDQEGLFKEEILGPLANLFTVDKDYELAMSLALGFALQNVVVRGENKVKDMIGLLKKRDLGRVTFLPLNRYQRQRSLSNPPPGVLGYAKDFIHCEDQYRGLFSSLLGSLVFVESYDQGLSLSKKSKLKIISLKGDVFHPGGSITGGSTQKGRVQIVNQEKRLNDQAARLKSLEILLTQKTAQVEDINTTYSALEDALEDQRVKAQGFNDKLFKLGQKLEGIKQGLDLQLKQEDNLKEDLRLAKEDCAKEEEKLKSYVEMKAKKDKEEEGLASYDMEEQTYQDQVKDLDKKKGSVQDQRLNLARLEDSIEFLEEKTQDLDQAYETSQRRLKEISKEQVDLQVLLKEKSQGLKNWKDAYKDKEEALNLRKAKQEEEKKTVHEKSETLAKAKEEVQVKDRTIQDLQQKAQEKHFQKEKIQLDLDHQEERFLERYGSIDQDLLELPWDKSETNLKAEVTSLGKKIEAFGPMNARVLEDYNEVKDRSDFQNKQREDLILAKEELNQVLENLDKKMRKAFLESFQEITGYFQTIFAQLFRGGKADILLEEGPVLEAGIEIKAQPPGKKLQSLSLLSGGERSLTAVALIFALLKYRPAPFCILDEIDAALDDANIDRYVDYILGLEDVQFIMITHRKPTMEIAHVLYGVTMEEKGISSIVPMKLRPTGQ